MLDGYSMNFQLLSIAQLFIYSAMLKFTISYTKRHKTEHSACFHQNVAQAGQVSVTCGKASHSLVALQCIIDAKAFMCNI